MKILFLLIFVSQSFATPREVIFKSGGDLTFLAVGKPSFLKINGKSGKAFGKFSYDTNFIKGIFQSKLNDYTTGISLRDRHMKEKYLETGKYPTTTLHLLKVDNFETIAGKDGKLETTFSGTLHLHGVEKSVQGTAVLEKNGKSFHIEAKFKFLLSDFKIDVPKYAGVTVANEVEVSLVQDASEK